MICIALGVISGVVGAGVLVHRRRMLAIVHARYAKVAEEYREEGREMDQASIPGLGLITFIGLGACLVSVIELIVGIATLR